MRSTQVGPFVGRDTLVSQIVALTAPITLVYGDPGCGKSRIMQEVAHRLECSDACLGSKSVPLRFQPGSLQLGLFEALSDAMADFVRLEPDMTRAARIFANAADRTFDERVKEMVTGAKGLVIGLIRARFGDEAADLVKAFGENIDKAKEAELGTRVRAASDKSALEAFRVLATELGELAGRPVVLVVDGLERLTDDDFRMLLDLVHELPDRVHLIASHSVANAADLERARKLSAQAAIGGRTGPTASGHPVPPLDSADIERWVQEAIPSLTGAELLEVVDELQRLTGGIPLHLDIAISHLKRGESLARLEPRGDFLSLTADNFASLSVEEQRVVTVLAAFSAPPAPAAVMGLLEVDEVAWAVLERSLIEKRVLVSPVGDRWWFHELGRRALWDRIFTPAQREAAAAGAVPAIAELVAREGGASFADCIDLARLCSDAPAVGQSYDRLDVVMALSDGELAVLGALIELTEASNDGALELLVVVGHARDRFGATGDLVAAVRSLQATELLVVAENDAVAVIVPAWGSSVARFAAIGRIATRFDRLPVASLASAVFQGFLIPAIGPFHSGSFGLGEPGLAELGRMLRESEFDRTGPSVEIHERPGLIIRGRNGQLGLWGAFRFDTDSERDQAASALRATVPTWILGDSFSLDVVDGWPALEGVADRRFTSAAGLATKLDFNHWHMGSSGLPIVDDWADAMNLRVRTWAVLRELAGPLERAILRAETERGLLYSEGESGCWTAEVRGRGDLRDLGPLEVTRFGLDLMVELERHADLGPGQRLERLTYNSGGPRNPVGEMLTETQKMLNSYNQAQRHERRLCVPAEQATLEAVLNASVRQRRADAEALVASGILPSPKGPLGRQEFVIIDRYKSERTGWWHGRASRVTYEADHDSAVRIVFSEDPDDYTGGSDLEPFRRHFELPSGGPSTIGGGNLSSVLATMMSASSVSLPLDWLRAKT